jgi:hypothetical protein
MNMFVESTWGGKRLGTEWQKALPTINLQLFIMNVILIRYCVYKCLKFAEFARNCSYR